MTMSLLKFDQFGQVLIERLGGRPLEAKVLEDFDPFGIEFGEPLTS
eukprot:CAMPEP_0204615872 /NCGR_PEP_ID=MMETSP0717-20131115/3251_1 /ASSEMBLY_ACC=CAM_ASM_000666 /TAXON_ID=230516 /ORGANISM="Chaetoceros curvisetus" /LENGTH=45 /DNA_ID= /DNA_START= /DNA_END= /DNA_ORIENTATION=